MPELVGEDRAKINARQAQIGKMLQTEGLKAIMEERMKPENFTQAKDSIRDGIKIEREALESSNSDDPKTNIFNDLAFIKQYERV